MAVKAHASLKKREQAMKKYAEKECGKSWGMTTKKSNSPKSRYPF